MSHRFVFEADGDDTTIRLLGPGGPVPSDAWASEAPDILLPGVNLARRLEAARGGIFVGDAFVAEAWAIARLSAAEAARLGLPPLTDAVARVTTRGVFTRPEFRAELEWLRPSGQAILGARRTGPWLVAGGELRRLPDELHALARAVDALAAPIEDDGARLEAVAHLREALPPAVQGRLARAEGLVGTAVIAVADAFSLGLGEGPDARLVPVLHRAGGEPDAPLLGPAHQETFARRFDGFGEARTAYALGGGAYVVLQPPLRRALAAVRRANDAPPGTRRALLANPRAFLREALGEEADEVLVEGVFRETAAYADRVRGLGLWVPRVIPWVKLPATDWFGEGEAASRPKSSPRKGGIRVGTTDLPLTSEAAAALADEVRAARAAGRPTVPVPHGDGVVEVPATAETAAALDALAGARGDAVGTTESEPETSKSDEPRPEVLIIVDNEDEVGAETLVTAPRPAPSPGLPRCLATALKPHQADGLAWLQAAWGAGLPGVLLADDMGLGKTLQGLAFLAWLREAMTGGSLDRAPVLVIAPTGLLRNWAAEHDRHLAAPGLGTLTEAFGRGLARLKRPGPDGRPALDYEAMARADWVLTTYETLRDYDRDFGRVRFAVLLMDEAQKIKTPGVRITDAAKAMNAGFRVALTGTPVENRLADLWCIADAVQPGVLGDLKGFSATYEREPHPDRLRALKASLDEPLGGRPPLMLRRLARDRLPGLPEPDLRERARPMPPVQRAAYEAALGEARGSDEPGAVLKALQRLRAISLHPDPEGAGGDEAFIAASARLRGAFEALDEAAAAGEKALVFLDDLGLQARLAGVIQRRYRLPAPPALINGSVDGAARQARVEAFQAAPGGFGVMILSPRAGGVGLTLTAANHAVHLSRWWNPAVEDQCTGRVLRIGQARPVRVHLPLAVLDDDAPSFDRNLDALLARKRRLMRDTLMPAEATARADADELFRATVGAGV